MDTTPQYVDMCGSAFQLRADHIIGDGDYLWDGSKAVLLGENFRGEPRKLVDERSYIRFAFPAKNLVYEATTDSDTISEVQVKTEDWVVRQINHAIWLPRLNQLFDMISKKCDSIRIASSVIYDFMYPANRCRKILNGETCIDCELKEKHRQESFRTIYQYYLGAAMHFLYGVEWDRDGKGWCKKI